MCAVSFAPPGLGSTRTRTPGCARGYVLAPLRGASAVIDRRYSVTILRYDAGMDGFSVEAYLRPWWLRWGLRSRESYLGAEATYHFGYASILGAVLVATTGSSRQVTAIAKLGLVMPFR